MIVGFTGTHLGMSLGQQDELRTYLRDLRCIELHHGDCIGADAQADAIARSLNCRIVVHPPTNSSKRAWVNVCEGVVILPTEPYLERNKRIVEQCEILLATPASKTELVRSGTWSTVRYARKIGRTHHIIFP